MVWNSKVAFLWRFDSDLDEKLAPDGFVPVRCGSMRRP